MGDAHRFLITTPATSANLGPGFDCLALALDLYNTVEVLRLDADAGISISVDGEGAGTLPLDARNLIVVSMQLLAANAGCVLPSFRLKLRNRIPLGRGLGSSAAAIVSGLLAARALLALNAQPLDLLRLALSLEGHPDNISACLLGGLTVSVLDNTVPLVQRLDVPHELRAVVLVPELFASTQEARAVLPTTLSRADAVFNAGRTALLAAAIANRNFDVLRVSMQDRWHQPYRCKGFPYLDDAIAAALAAGAAGAALSGAGSSVLALTTGNELAIEAALLRVARIYEVPARALRLGVSRAGATCEAVLS